jgi:hypothetical protein
MATVAKVCYLPGVVKFEEALPATVSSVRAGRTETERGGEAVRVAADSTPDMCFSRSVLGVFHFVRERRQRKVSEVVGAVLCFQHTNSQSQCLLRSGGVASGEESVSKSTRVLCRPVDPRFASDSGRKSLVISPVRGSIVRNVARVPGQVGTHPTSRVLCRTVRNGRD